jgi:hypothetical protein
VALGKAGYRALADGEPAWNHAQAWLDAADGAGSYETLDQWLVALDPNQPAQ